MYNILFIRIMEIDHWGGLWIIQQRSVHLFEPPPIINSNSSGEKKKTIIITTKLNRSMMGSVMNSIFERVVIHNTLRFIVRLCRRRGVILNGNVSFSLVDGYFSFEHLYNPVHITCITTVCTAKL